jgi:hypothetical protein
MNTITIMVTAAVALNNEKDGLGDPVGLTTDQ